MEAHSLASKQFWPRSIVIHLEKKNNNTIDLGAKDPNMIKVVFSLLFAAFALTTALPLRNRFFEDIDDYKRDFLPKKVSDFYEAAYDEYLRRREPVERSEGSYINSPDFLSRPYIL